MGCSGSIGPAGHHSPLKLAHWNKHSNILTYTHAISVSFRILEGLLDGRAVADTLDLDLDQVLQAKEFLELHSVLGTECHGTETENPFAVFPAEAAAVLDPKQIPRAEDNPMVRLAPNTSNQYILLQSIT